jgi:hypothetical protein
MDYETFKAVFEDALRASHLPVIGWANESLDLESLERTYTVHVEPLRRGDAEPFHTAATVSWRWSALQTARTVHTENELMSELTGRRRHVRTDKPWLRVDLKLSASLMMDKLLPMPSPSTWAAWAEETAGRLDTIERLIPEKDLRQGRGGRLEVLAWRGATEVTVQCDADGALMLSGVTVEAFEVVTLPRADDELERKDPGPEKQLQRMFKRLTASLAAWSEVMDHLAA